MWPQERYTTEMEDSVLLVISLSLFRAVVPVAVKLEGNYRNSTWLYG
jgi:hypothetical protein